MNRPLLSLAAALMLALPLHAARAADNEPPKAAAPDKLAAARTAVKQKNWAVALDELKKVNDTGSADWNNLMGYTLRKGTPPDLTGAERYYTEALRIDPKHRGALEYSGELYLMTGELAKAEQRLAALDKACTLSCEEYRDLKKAVANYKANGKYTPQ